MSGETTAESIEECNLAGIILLTLHLADRRGGLDFYKLVQFSRRNNPEALFRVRGVTKMQKPYALFGDRI